MALAALISVQDTWSEGCGDVSVSVHVWVRVAVSVRVAVTASVV